MRFYLGASLANLIRGHVEAFSALGGTARTVLYDNMRSVVLERRADAIRFHPTRLELAAHYRFEPRPVAPARGNEKGRVERLIRFVRGSFFQARRFRDLDDLNDQADQWCSHPRRRAPLPRGPTAHRRRRLRTRAPPPSSRCPTTRSPCEERVEVHVGKTPYVRFDGNDSSIPHRYVARTLTVCATLDTVRILDAATVLATHRRSFDRGQQVEDPRHIEKLERHKRLAREHRATDRLHHGAPSSKALFAAAQRNHHLGVLARALIALLNAHGPTALERAIVAALQSDAAYLGGVRHFIDQHRKESDKPPPLALDLPHDPRLRTLSVRPHNPRRLRPPQRRIRLRRRRCTPQRRR